MKFLSRSALLAALSAVVVATPGVAHAAAGSTTTLVSTAPDGANADDASWTGQRSLSANGRYLAYVSWGTNIVPGDTNAIYDVFVWDRVTRTSARVSLATGGGQADHGADHPQISADGRFIAYDSFATNLAPDSGSTDGAEIQNVYLYDQKTKTTTLVSAAPTGMPDADSTNPSVSGDGRYVAFASSATNLVAGESPSSGNIYVYDRRTKALSRVSRGTAGAIPDDGSSNPSISADGRYVAFESYASNLVPGTPPATNRVTNVYVYDRRTQTTTLASPTVDGSPLDRHANHPSISGDGRYVAYDSWAANIVAGDTNGRGDLFVFDQRTKTTARVPALPGDSVEEASLSLNGRYVAFSSRHYASTNPADETADVLVYDQRTRKTVLATAKADGSPSAWSLNPSLSADGSLLAFSSTFGGFGAGDGAHHTQDAYLMRQP